MNLKAPRCACGCGATILRAGKRGPSPQYASAACRKRVERRRKAEAVVLPDMVQGAPTVEGVNPDEQVRRALLEARAIGFAFLRLGSQARPELRWRCTKVGQAIVDAIGESFGKEML